MNRSVYLKKQFHKLLEKACKGTSITPRELLRELVNSGYKNLYDLDLSLDDLKMIVSDLEDSKETSVLYSYRSGAKTEMNVND